MLAPAAPLARVMRVVNPAAQTLSTPVRSEIPAGYSLDDYEDAPGTSTEQDDDEGWGVVPVKNKKSELLPHRYTLTRFL